MAPMERPVETAKMQLVSLKLEAAGKGTLRDYLAKAREVQEDSLPRATWDDIAFDLWTQTEVKVVRESVRMWAEKYGLLEQPKAEVAGA